MLGKFDPIDNYVCDIHNLTLYNPELRYQLEYDQKRLNWLHCRFFILVANNLDDLVLHAIVLNLQSLRRKIKFKQLVYLGIFDSF